MSQTLVKVKRKIVQLLLVGPAAVFVVCIRILRPVFMIRLGVVSSQRIGHLSSELDAYFWEVRHGLSAKLTGDIWFPFGPVSNKFLLDQWRNHLRIWPASFFSIVHRLNRIIPGGSVHEIPKTSWLSLVSFHTSKGDSEVKLTKSHCDEGIELKMSIGIPPNARYICILGRDPEYLKEHLGLDLVHHACRNVDISTYSDAALALANMGYYVLRMGSKVRDPLVVDHHAVIDYANSPLRCDFLDIYLSATCEFFVSVGSGLDSVATLFRRPIVVTNYLPITPLVRHYDFVLPKTLVWKDSGMELSIGEMIQHSLFHDNDYKDRGITVIDNSPDQLRDAIMDFEARFRGPKVDPELDSQSNSFWEIFTREYVSDWLPDVDTMRPPIARSFLARHPELMP